MNRKDVLDFLSSHKVEFHKKFQVKKIGLFGSFVRDEATENSDIDIIVDMPSSFDNFMDLKHYLQEHLHRKIDLIKEKQLRLFIKKQISQEIVYV